MGSRTSSWRASEMDGEHFVRDLNLKPSPLTEEQKAGWHQQTLKLYDSHSSRLIHFLRRLGLNKDEMDDVIQESFLRLAKHLQEGRSEGNLTAWLYRVAHNLAMDVHRSNRREHEEAEPELEIEERIDPDPDPEWVYLQKERTGRLKAALTQLTSQQYNSILLRAQGLRYREIGKTLGVSEQRAVHLVKRALQLLVSGE